MLLVDNYFRVRIGIASNRIGNLMLNGRMAHGMYKLTEWATFLAMSLAGNYFHDVRIGIG